MNCEKKKPFGLIFLCHWILTKNKISLTQNTETKAPKTKRKKKTNQTPNPNATFVNIKQKAKQIVSRLWNS